MTETETHMPNLTVFFALPSFLGLFTGRDADWVPGGAEVQMAHLVRALAARDDVEVVLVVEGEPPRVTQRGVRVSGAIPPIKRGLPLVSRVINRNRLARAFEAKSPNRVLLQGQLEPKWMVDGARACGVQLAYWVNGDSLVDGSRLRSSETLDEVIERINEADLVLVQSERQRQMAEDNLRIAARVVGSGYPLGELHAHPVPEHGYVLWIGRCDPIKRPWIVIELAKRFPQQQFVMLMPGRGLLRDEIGTEAALLGNLRLIDALPRHEVLELYTGSAFVLNTSISEGMPNVFIEGAMAGRPLLSYAVDPESMFADGAVGMCANNDFEELVRDLERMLGDLELRRSMGEAARRYSELHWDIAAVAEQYVNAFNSLFEHGSMAAVEKKAQ